MSSQGLELCGRSAAPEDFSAKFPTIDQGANAIGDEEGGSGVQQHCISFGTVFFPPQQCQNNGSVRFGITAGEVAEGGRLKFEWGMPLL